MFAGDPDAACPAGDDGPYDGIVSRSSLLDTTSDDRKRSCLLHRAGYRKTELSGNSNDLRCGVMVDAFVAKQKRHTLACTRAQVANMTSSWTMNDHRAALPTR
jgi:hypothetical protein